MKKKSIYFLTTLFLTSISSMVLGQAAPGEETGKKIGTIVKSAIETALPGVNTLLGLVWNKTDGQKMNKAEVQTQLDATRKKLSIEAQKKVEPMNRLALELLLVNRFLEPSVNANINVIRLQTRMLSQTALTDNEWQLQKTDWSVAKSAINQLKNITDNDINTVRDTWLRNTLKKIRDASGEPLIRIDDALNQKDAKTMGNNLEKLSLILQDIPAVVGYELSDLQVDVKELGQWASGAMGGDTELSEQQKSYKSFLSKKYPD